MNRILFAGGGTAGHIEPALATANAWRKKYPGDRVNFLGTKDGLEQKLIPANELILIPKVVAPRSLTIPALISPIQLTSTVSKTLKIVKNFDVVVGFGGYVSAPAYLAAAILRKPIIIHEANAKPGLANRMGAKFASEIGVGYELATLQLPNAKVVGNPLKDQIILASKQIDWAKARSAAKKRIAAANDLPMILILGGSQGARSINNVISQVNLSNYFVLHSVGASNELPAATTNYRPVTYINEMADALLAADLIISRSGAIACSEIAALGRYALFIPLPIGNGEQALNAQALINAGRAELIMQRQFNSDWLANHLPNLMKSALESPETPLGTPLNAPAELVAMIESVLT
ncbi:MAG: hypothetical protein RLZ57_386 [Actinomycetota bacterium]